MIERRIKELSIALEALSRINGYDASNHHVSVSDLLGKAIQEAKEYANNTRPPPTPPAPKPWGSDTKNNDDIPF